MVTYPQFTSVVFDVATAEGAQFDSINDGQAVIKVAADVWQDRKEELQTATLAEARDVARQEVQVS